MPPPKKPKTGLTRVEEYLTEKDLEELKQKSKCEFGNSSSDESDSRESDTPISTTCKDILESFEFDNSVKQNGSICKEHLDITLSSNNGVNMMTKDPLKEVQSNCSLKLKNESKDLSDDQDQVQSASISIVDANEHNNEYKVETQKDVTAVRNDVNIHGNGADKNGEINVHSSRVHKNIESIHPNGVHENGKINTPLSGGHKNGEYMITKKFLKIKMEKYTTDQISDHLSKEKQNINSPSANNYESKLYKLANSENREPPKMRKLETLMMRRQVDSLMDVLHPVLPVQNVTKDSSINLVKQGSDQKQLKSSIGDSSHSFALDMTSQDIEGYHKERRKSISKSTNKDTYLAKTMECDTSKESRLSTQNGNLPYSADGISSSNKYMNHPDLQKLFKNNGLTHMNPISSLQKMLSPDFNNFNPQNNHFLAQTAGLLRLPFMYQRKLPFSNLHDLCLENNRIPNIATKPQPFLNSSQNINTMRATRPSLRHNGKAFLPINDIKKISQQPCGLDVYQSNTNEKQELTSSELYSKYMKMSIMEAAHNDSLRAMYFNSKENEDQGYVRPPPLIPISNIVSSSNIPKKAYREPMDPGYGETNSSVSNQGSDLQTNITETDQSYNNDNKLGKDRKEKNVPSTSQELNMYNRNNSTSATNSSSASSGLVVSSAASTTQREYQQPEYGSHYGRAMGSGVISSNNCESSGTSLQSLSQQAALPSSSGSIERPSSHFVPLSQIPSPSKIRGEEPSPTPHHLPSPLEMPSSTVEDKRRRSLEDRVQGRRCQICNDCASGFHYGVWSCEGCKAFFKRSLQGPVDYVCPSTNNCTIDKQRRKSCQACRLRKCIEMGMSRGNCRKERKLNGPRGPKRKSEGSDIEPFGPSDLKIKRADSSHSSPGIDGKEMKIDMPLSISTAAHSTTPRMSPSSSSAPITPPGMNNESIPPPAHATSSPHQYRSSNSHSRHNDTDVSPNASQTSQITTSQLPIHPLAEHLIRIDPPMRSSGHDSSKRDSEVHLMASLMRLADLELVDVINWAKSIPGYTDLELKDRIHLLEVCWMEVLLVGILWHSLQNSDADQLNFATDLTFDRSRLEVANLSVLGNSLLTCLKEFANLHINQEEFVLFRSLVLLNSDLSETASSTKINQLRNQILEALHYTVIERYHGSLTKVMGMLTLLPHTRQLSIHWVGHLMSCPTSQYLSMYALLKEMVDAHINSTEHYYRNNTTISASHSNASDPMIAQRNEFQTRHPSDTITSPPILSPAVNISEAHINGMYMRCDSYDNMENRRGSPV